MAGILIFDDDENIRRTYRELLSSEGYLVRETSEPERAFHILETTPIDLVLLDIRMPVEGTMLKVVLRAWSAHLKIMIASVYSLDEQRRKIPDADAYFDKSQGIEILLSQIRKVLAV